MLPKLKKKGIILPKVSSVITKYIKSNLRIKY